MATGNTRLDCDAWEMFAQQSRLAREIYFFGKTAGWHISPDLVCSTEPLLYSSTVTPPIPPWDMRTNYSDIVMAPIRSRKVPLTSPHLSSVVRCYTSLCSDGNKSTPIALLF